MAPTLRQVGIFAKHWTPGAVKTRLAARVGPELAARVAHAFIGCLVERLNPLPYSKQLGFAPEEQREAFQALAPRWSCRPQCAGDLGARMTDYFDASFASGFEQTLLLGADCPTIPLKHLDDAFQQLETHDVAIAPAFDGGYCLIAARATPPLFDHGQWGDARVLERTLALAERRHLSVALLPPWRDVDHWDDLLELHEQLQRSNDPIWRPLQAVVRHVLEQAS